MTTGASPDRIHRLPQHIANQIAAGEVVQRPESLVKELVENALDAGATRVTVVIAGAGKQLVQVIDDGRGMSEDDALLAFERHATSKISSADDLETISTFGFRGEALPSIASVAKVELRTRPADSDVAFLVRIEGGTLEERTRVQGEPGTSIAVKNLFFNTPARRQFLKADSTEYRHIADTVQRAIISNPDVHFTLINDGERVYDVPPMALRGRIAAVFGERAAASLVEVREETDLLTITGFVGRPDFARKTRGEQLLFVNTRSIVSRLLNHAVVSAYEHMLQQGEYPMYVLFLNLNPREIDVNVHPSKLEVKFSNERHVYSLVNAVVRRSLYGADLSPALTFRDPIPGGDETARTRLAAPGTGPADGGDRFRGIGYEHPSYADRAPAGGRMDPAAIDSLFQSLGLPSQHPSETQGDGGGQVILLPSERPVSDTSFLWQLHNKYIFTPIKSGLMIIDQHVAHERILYERALAALDHAAPFSQQLLFPHTFRVAPGDYALLVDILAELRRLGFVLRVAPPDSVTVEAVPQDVRVGMEERILEEMIEQYKEYSGTGTTDVRHNVAASYSCRAAIKTGEKLSPPEMQILIDQLFATSNPYVCPHGRPVVIRLPLDELDRRFGRTS